MVKTVDNCFKNAPREKETWRGALWPDFSKWNPDVTRDSFFFLSFSLSLSLSQSEIPQNWPGHFGFGEQNQESAR